MNLRQTTPTAPALLRSEATSAAVPDETLLVAVMDAAEAQLANRQTEAVSDLYAPLLRILTCSYASGVYSSREIETSVRADPTLRWLTGDRQPSAASLRAFRRHNREALAQCLVDVLEQTAQSHLNPGCGTRRRAPLAYAAHSLGRWQMTPAPADLRPEADRRINRAIRFDSAELDD